MSVEFDRTDAPDGQNTVPLSITYLEAEAGDGTAGDRLVLRIEYPDLCQALRGVHVVETPVSVLVTGVGAPLSDGPCPLRLRVVTGTVLLDAPLGGRTVTAGR